MLKGLPAELTNDQWQMVAEINRAPLPALPKIGDKAFSGVMKLLDTLPRRRDDADSGEVRYRVYEIGLRHLPAAQIWWTVHEAIKRCKWCPTVKEFIDIAEEWQRADDPVLVKREASRRFNQERIRRMRVRSPAPPLTQDMVDAMTEEQQRMGLKCGALIEKDGKVLVNPEPIEEEPQA